jgi:dTDP-4-dehydrorhamnose 3,5-epimerase
MNVIQTAIEGVLVIEPKVFGDARGYFYETFSVERYAAHGITAPFVQDNLSKSERGILRGLHIQNPHQQGKLVSVAEGEVYDVALDIRSGSPTFGKHVAQILSAENKRQMWIPKGFAHGFLVTSPTAIFTYKCTDSYHPECELGVAWDDPDLGINWPIKDPRLSAKDQKNPRLRDIPKDQLPQLSSPPAKREGPGEG